MVVGNINALKEEIDEVREDLIYDKRGKEYSIDDLYLVRATNFLPVDGLLKPISEVPFFTKSNNLIHRVVLEHIKELYNPNLYEDGVYNKINEYIRDNYIPLTTQYRSTIHFTINGRVSSHSKGDFDHNLFVLIDPFKFHLDNNSLVGLRVEDTYMQGSSKVSPDLVVLVSEDKYEEALSKYPQLNQFNVVLYKGDQSLAVESYLESINVIPERIGEHGSSDHKCSDSFRNLLRSISKTYNIPMEKHCYSSVYKDDDEKSLVLWEYYRREFFSYFLSRFNLPMEDLNLLSSLDDSDLAFNKLNELVNKIGYEEFKKVVLEFNSMYLNKVKDGSYKCNRDLINELNGLVLN